MKRKTKKVLLGIFVAFCFVAVFAHGFDFSSIFNVQTEQGNNQNEAFLSSVADYSSTPYIELDGNLPNFSEEELVTETFEKYSELDSLGRCGVAYACIGKDIMPTEERGRIGQVKPTGWHLIKYDVVDGKYLYNRCHLIGYQLAGENANTKNLITGTRYLNVEGMLPFENMVADYVEETENHVLYRVTPYFEGDNLLASGVQIEAYSVEDEGEGICFNVYIYNVQPGVTINYATGESKLTETGSSSANTGTSQTTDVHESDVQEPEAAEMVWKSAAGSKYHCVNDCGSMNPDEAQQLTKEEAEEQGLEPCSRCY